MIARHNLISKIKSIDGFLRDDEALLLFDLAKKTPGQQAIAEIGSWKGKSTICLSSGSKLGTNSPVYAIDPHTGSPEHRQLAKKVNTFTQFKLNLKRTQTDKLVTALKTTSFLASKKFNKPIKLLFIDGDHSYQAVKQDFLNWSPKLIDGGFVVFHDTISWPGPRRLVLEKIYPSSHYKNIKLLGSITYAQKTSNLTLIDKCKNYYSLHIRYLRNFFAALTLPTPLRFLAKSALQIIQ